MSEEIKLTSIKKLSVECKKCGTKTILDIGKSINKCGVCGNFLMIKYHNPFELLKQAIEAMDMVEEQATYKIVCEGVKR